MDLSEISRDVGELKVIVTKIDTSMQYSLEADKKRDEQLTKLTEQMDTALIPIRYFKTSLAIFGGASVIIGCLYGAIQLYQAVGTP